MTARRGANAVEFALSLPIILLLVVATIDFTLWTQTSYRLARAVHDGARVGVATLTDSAETDPQPILDATEDAIRASAELGGLDTSRMKVAATWDIDGDGVAWVTVEAEAQYLPIIGLRTPFQRPVIKRFAFVPKEQPFL